MPRTFDPASDRVVLAYVGDGRPIAGVPARDLTEHDLCRIQHRRELAAVSVDVGRPVDPDNPDAGVIVRPNPRTPSQAGVAALLEELVARRQFVVAEPEKPAKPSKSKPAPAADAPKEV